MPTYSSLSYPQGKSLYLDSCSEPVREFLLNLTTTWSAEGAMLKNGSRSTVLRTEIDGAPYILKIYKKMAFHRRLRYALTRSRAFQSWDSGQSMAEAGIPVAQPLAILEERNFCIPGRSILLMPVAHGNDLLTLVQENKLSSEQLEKIAVKLTAIFEQMKAASLTHGDMKATNILIDDQLNPMLIDIDGAILHRSAKSLEALRAKDAARFMKNWQIHPEAQEVFRDVFGKTH